MFSLVDCQSPTISDKKDITVETLDISKGKLDKDTGMLEWEFTLGANETKELKLVYNVCWPKNETINI